jgi:DNA-binding SARP family transcriptional activator/tetratricopeptide (TPR) repeat protein
VEFRLLGPVELWDAGQRHELGSSKERCVLAILLWGLGKSVSADVLVDRLWDEHPPPKARNSLYSYVARLRSRLQRVASSGEVRLVSGSGCYTLEADPESVDLYRFRRLRAQASAIGDSGDDEQAALLLGEADKLWRGAALTGLGGSWADRTRASLAGERLAATQDRITAELRRGRHAEMLTELTDLVAEHPFTETLVEHLMVALNRSGRPAEALQVYRRTRDQLVRELGTDPSQALRDLQQRILLGDPELAPRPPASPAPRTQAADNLPRDIPNFTGRGAELRWLQDVVAAEPARTATVVVTIDGMAGSGKSTLALHAAHQLRDDFPGGRLYLQLHAHDASREPLDPAVGLDALLRLLGVPADRIPRTLEERATLWRTQLAYRRALVVLDDAASQEQVAPLLPGSASCLVIITSRTRLAGLAGIRELPLGVLSSADAAALFTSIADTVTVSDQEHVAEITRLCGQLPLAIQLVASRLARRSAWSASDLAERLSAAADRTGEIYTSNPEIAASFALSYQELSGEQRQLFRQLSLHPGPDFGMPAAAAGAGASAGDCERSLAALLDSRLLEEPVRGRYRSHNLIGAYARDLALRHDPESDRRETTRRFLDYYRYAADQADRILYPHRDRIDVRITGRAPVTPLFSGPQAARKWLAAELGNLLSAARQAAEGQLPEHAALIAHVLAEFLQTHGHWEEAIALHAQAISAWRVTGDRNGEARALTDLAVVLTRAGRYGETLQNARQALAIFRAEDDRHGQAAVLDHIGLVYCQSSRFQQAVSCHEQALILWRALGDRHGEASSLAHSAMPIKHIGGYGEALERFGQALSVYQDMRDSQGEARTLNNIAVVEEQLGLYDDALRRYQRAQAVAQDTGERQGEAITFNNMGVVYSRMGQYQESLANYRKALAIYRDIGDRSSEADVLNNIGSAFQRIRHLGEAAIHHQKALAIAHELAEPYQEARSLSGTGAVHLMSGRYGLALEDYQAALELSRLIGDPYQEGLALDGVGDAHIYIAGAAAAQTYWREALAIFERIGVPEADEVRVKLEASARSLGEG